MRIHVRNYEYQLSIGNNNPKLPKLILLHGFMGSGTQFSHLSKSLDSFCNPVCIDLLGHGSTDGSDDPAAYQSDSQVGDLYHLICRLKPGPLFLHGYSMGGRLALRFALDYSEMLSGLILESTMPGLKADERRVRKKLDEERAEAIMNNFSHFLMNWNENKLFNPVRNKQAGKMLESIQQKQNPDYMAASLRGFGSGQIHGIKNQLDSINCPVLLLCGEEDQKYLKINADMHHHFINSDVRVIRNAGHRVHLDQPESWIHAINTFITKNS